LRENHRRVITNALGRAAGNGHRVLDHLYDHPTVSVADIQNLTGTTYQAANELVARLEDEGILTEITGQSRNRRFRYQSYIDLFSDLTAEPDDL
jgi:DNA-binding MarR family transcriptional regulator